jgi:hypothetical protein
MPGCPQPASSGQGPTLPAGRDLRHPPGRTCVTGKRRPTRHPFTQASQLPQDDRGSRCRRNRQGVRIRLPLTRDGTSVIRTSAVTGARLRERKYGRTTWPGEYGDRARSVFLSGTASPRIVVIDRRIIGDLALGLEVTSRAPRRSLVTALARDHPSGRLPGRGGIARARRRSGKDGRPTRRCRPACGTSAISAMARSPSFGAQQPTRKRASTSGPEQTARP